MSLNGLDSAEVQEAYNVAIAEAGGWFLLKYTSRDSVDLLGRGKGGVLQARHALATYSETSPLYGLIIYRRRKVLIKYIPEGTSRVLKARTAVHFQDVLEKYAPYETLVEITSPEGLNDTSLAAAFPLHTATPSASSSRLDEISEDAEDGGASVQSFASQNTSMSSYFESQRNGTADRQSARSPPSVSHARKETSPIVSPVSSPLASPKKASVSQFLVRDDSGQRSITPLVSPSLASSTQYTTSEEPTTRDTQSTRSSAETAKPSTPTFPQSKQRPVVPIEQPGPPALPEKLNVRLRKATDVRTPNGSSDRPLAVERAFTSPAVSEGPSISSERPRYDDDPYDFSRFDIKPKVKLGPRPVAPGEKAKRPMVASISSVPATYRPTTKRQEQQKPRPKSQGPISGAVLAPTGIGGIPRPPPIPDMPEYNPRPVSRGSVKSLPSHKSTAMTPDKIRLMKAVELRKKQLRKSNPQADTFVPPPDEEVPVVPKVPVLPATPTTNVTTEISLPPDITPPVDRQSHSNKDSGISMEYDRADERDDEDAPDLRQTEDAKPAPAEPSSPAAKKFQMPVSQSPRVDTPRVNRSQAFEKREPEPEPHAAQRVFDHSDLADLLMPFDAIQSHAVNSTPRQINGTVNEEATSPKRDAGVPKIIMADGSRPISATVNQTKTEKKSPTESDSSGDEDINDSGDLDTPEKNVRRQNSDIAKRRRGFIEPLHDDLSSDDDFMDELQSATVHQAKPMTVARSPVAHYFPRRPSYNSAISDLSINSVRAVNIANGASTMPLGSPDTQESLTPDPTSHSPGHSRSVSSPLLNSYEPTGMVKRNAPAGVSKGVKTLVERSSLEDNVYDTSMGRPLTSDASSSNFPTVDQRELKKSPPTTSRTSSFRAMSRNSSRISSYQKQAAANAAPHGDSNAVWNVQHDGSANVDSVSVSARIIRTNPPQPADSTPETEPELQPSQLVINHRRGTPSQTNVPQLHRIDTNPKLEAFLPEPSNSRTTSPTMTRSPIEGPRTMHSQSKFGRHKATPSHTALSPIGPTADDFPPPPTSRYQAPNAAPFIDENSKLQESTRTSRFFKRMSNITGNKRRSVGLQSHGSSSSPASERGSLMAHNISLPGSKDKPEAPPALIVGDLNIQFPDSLLWKRRIVEIDDHGSILFSIPQATEIQRGAAKKFQLSDFKMPYVPDLDRQELPNSIMLDFVEEGGTTLQIACEDTMTHRQVVHVLKSYWRAWVGTS